jgi:hypothetical protein
MRLQKEEKVVQVKNTFGTNSAAKILRKWLNITANLPMENITPLPTPQINKTLLLTSLQITEHCDQVHKEENVQLCTVANLVTNKLQIKFLVELLLEVRSI